MYGKRDDFFSQDEEEEKKMTTTTISNELAILDRVQDYAGDHKIA